MPYCPGRSVAHIAGTMQSSLRSSVLRPCGQGIQGHRLARPTTLCKASRADREPHLQLATAKLPGGVNVPAFATYMYQWASTMTQSGANYPFVLPVQTDRLPSGFKISLLKSIAKGQFAGACDIEATVEELPEGNIFLVRFYEGPAALVDRRTDAPTNPTQRLESVLQGLVDVPTIMQTMPGAIRKAVQLSKA